MNEIVEKRDLGPDVAFFRVKAPKIARKRKPGQFVIIRLCEGGERIPISVAGADPERGTIDLIVQAVGKTTSQMLLMGVGDVISDVVGPLGSPTHIERFGTVVCVGGGIGIAAAHPIAKALKEAGNVLLSIIGARTRKLLILEGEMGEISDELFISTDDGSYGRKGFVTDILKELIDSGRRIDYVLAVGPIPMMRAVSDLTKPYGIKTVVSLNPIMVDGTGMCGGCRVSVGGQTKFACVDGPEFDGHLVDFDVLAKRNRAYLEYEREAMERFRRELQT